MKMERQMNFKEDCRKRTEKIEEILRKYLPDQTGHQQIIEEAMEYSLMRWKTPSSDAHERDV